MNSVKNLQPIVISAPSGAGKTTLNRRLVDTYPQVKIVTSHTTRLQRPGEIDGVHYHFVSEKEFKRHISENGFVEWALVHGRYYGTSKGELKTIQNNSARPVLEIDVQGWASAKSQLTGIHSLFILPPSLLALWKRLEKRGSDTLEQRWGRFKTAYNEIQQAHTYELVIVNQDLEIAYNKLKSIVVDDNPQEEDFFRNHQSLCAQLEEEFHQAGWIEELRKELNDPK